MGKVQQFAMKVVGDITAIQMGTLNAVADRLGLFATLAEAGPVTVAEFARKAGIHERYAREWLSAMACHGYLTHDNAAGSFALPPEHAVVLADPDSSLYLTSAFAMAPSYYANVEKLTEAFLHGGGVPQDRFGAEFWCGFERFTRPGYRNNLVQDWIPAMPEAHTRLREGGAAADVGCGNGQALLYLAKGYPNATFVGFDAYAPAIAAATANAHAAGMGGGCASRCAT
jgi:hypothetical protein